MTKAEDWGTGRAVARIPRISDSGTNRFTVENDETAATVAEVKVVRVVTKETMIQFE